MRYTILSSSAICALAFSSIASAQEAQVVKNLAAQVAQGDGAAAVQIVKHGKAAVPPLINILQSDAKSLVRGHAAHALGRIGPAAKDAIPALTAALLGADVAVDGDRRVAGEASLALGRIGSASASVLVKTLSHRSPQVRALAAGALKQIKPLPKSIAPAVVAAFKKATKTGNLESLYLIDLIGELGASAKDALPALVAMAKKNLEIRSDAVVGQDQFALQSIAIHAIHAIGKMGAAGKDSVPFVIDVLKAKNAGIALQIHAIDVLGDVGPAAKQAAPIILELMKSGEGPPRAVLLKCLAKIGFSGDKTMKQALYQAMLDKDAETRIYAARIMGQKDPDDLTVVSVLLEAIRDRNADVRLLAARTLAVVRPTDESVIELLQAARKDTDPRVRQAVEATLKKYKK